MCGKSHSSVTSHSLWPHELQPARLLCPWGFSRQEYWNGLPCPFPGIKPVCFMSCALACGFCTTSATWEAQNGLDIPIISVGVLRIKGRASLVVQWLRLPSNTGILIQSLVGVLRSHMPHGQKQNMKYYKKQYCNKFNKDLKK